MNVVTFYRKKKASYHDFSSLRIKPEEGSDNLPVCILWDRIEAVIGLAKRRCKILFKSGCYLEVNERTADVLKHIDWTKRLDWHDQRRIEEFAKDPKDIKKAIAQRDKDIAAWQKELDELEEAEAKEKKQS